MNLNDRVVVSALATGTGESPHGWIDDVYEFTRETFYFVSFRKYVTLCVSMQFLF